MFVRIICTDELLISDKDSTPNKNTPDKNDPDSVDHYDLIINTDDIHKIEKHERYEDSSCVQEEQYSIVFTLQLRKMYITKPQFDQLINALTQVAPKENYVDLRLP